MKRPSWPCECRHNGYEWTRLCPLHEAEERELHERAEREYKARAAERERIATGEDDSWLDT